MASSALSEKANDDSHDGNIMDDRPWAEAHAEVYAAGAALRILRGAL